MDRLYIYSFYGKNVRRTALTSFLSKSAVITHWFYSLPNSVFIKTSLTPTQLSEIIEAKFGQHRHIIVEISNYYGRLPKEHWGDFPT